MSELFYLALLKLHTGKMWCCSLLEKILKLDGKLHFVFGNNKIINYLVLLSYAVSFYSPLLSWFISIALLILFSRILTVFQRRLLSVITVVTGSVIIASRRVFAPGASDDFLPYFQMYQSIESIDLWANIVATFDDVGLKIVFILFFKIFGILSPKLLLLMVAIMNCGLFLVWLELHGLKLIGKGDAGIAIGSTFIFFSYFHSTQLVPQMISSIMLIYALFSSQILIQILFLILATAFHETSIIFFIISYGTLRYPKYIIPLVSLSGLFFVGFNNSIREFLLMNSSYINNYSVIVYTVLHKIIFHMAYETKGYCLPDLQFVRYFVAMFVTYLYLLICDRQDKKAISWNSFIFLYVMLYFILMPLCLGPLRGTLILNSVLLGFALFKGFEKVPNFYSILLIYVLYGKFSYFLKKIPGDFQLFYTYDWYGFQPFYYFR